MPWNLSPSVMRRREVFRLSCWRVRGVSVCAVKSEKWKAVFLFCRFPLFSEKKSGNSGKSGNFSFPTGFLPDPGLSGVVFYRVFRRKMPLSLGLKGFIRLFTGERHGFCRPMFPDSGGEKIGERLFCVPRKGNGWSPLKTSGAGGTETTPEERSKNLINRQPRNSGLSVPFLERLNYLFSECFE